MQDKALRKILKTQAAHLPFGFSNRVMKQVNLKIEHKNRRNYIIGIIIASLTSVILLVVSWYAIHRNLSLNTLHYFPNITIEKLSHPATPYLIVFFGIVLLLLFLDLSLRIMYSRKIR